jgi:hypothetical protein
MIAKAGLVVAAIMLTVVGGRAIDLRGLYDQMYPISTLKRDVLNLCVESDPAFIRAMSDEREACYFRMPHTIALALGMVRPDNSLEELFLPWSRLASGGALLSEAGLGSWAAAYRTPPRALSESESVPCRPARDLLAGLRPGAIAEPTTPTVLSGRAGRGAKALTTLGLPPPAPRPALTIMPAPDPALAAAPAPAAKAPPGKPGDSLVLLDTEIAADLGDKGAASTGCSARI